MEEQKNFYKISRVDIAVIVLILLFSFAFVLRNTIPGFRSQAANKAFIYEDNKLFTEVDLKKDKILSLAGGRMQLEVKHGRIGVAKSDCPQHICMHTGRIRYSGQTIVCLPNKVLVGLEGNPQALDAVAY